MKISIAQENRITQGFTLVETIVYLAIFSIVATSVMSVFFSFESTAAQINERSAELADRMFIESVFRNSLLTHHEGDIVFLAASSTLMYKNTPLHGSRLKISDFIVTQDASATKYFLKDNFFEGTTTFPTFTHI